MSLAVVKVPEACVSAFHAAMDKRFVQFGIHFDNLAFTCLAVEGPGASLEEDMKAAGELVEETSPCIFAFRFETKWTMIAWVPEEAKVKHKMVFASAKSHLKTVLGTEKFDRDFFVATKKEFTMKNYNNHMDEETKKTTMTEEEKLYEQEIKDASPDAVTSSAMRMLDVPIEPSAGAAFAALKNGKKDTAIFQINVDTQALIASSPSNDTLKEVQTKIADDTPAYILMNWKHVPDREHTAIKTFILLYYCPDDSPPKLKMIYSTIKQNMVSACSSLGITLTKSIEFSLKSEFSDEEVHAAVYGRQVEQTQAFCKPKGPRNRKPRARP